MVKKFLHDSLPFNFEVAKESDPHRGYRTCDAFAMATVLDESVVTKSKSGYCTVELAGKFTRGQLIVDTNRLLDKEDNVTISLELDKSKIEQMLLSLCGE